MKETRAPLESYKASWTSRGGWRIRRRPRGSGQAVPGVRGGEPARGCELAIARARSADAVDLGAAGAGGKAGGADGGLPAVPGRGVQRGGAGGAASDAEAALVLGLRFTPSCHARSLSTLLHVSRRSDDRRRTPPLSRPRAAGAPGGRWRWRGARHRARSPVVFPHELIAESGWDPGRGC
jgi:hypothetical protein